MFRIKDITIIAFFSAILFVQEQLFSFLPNVQLTVFLIVLYSKVFGFTKTAIIILIHTLLDNIVMGSMNLYLALGLAAILSFVIAFGLGYVVIPFLRKLKFGQTILEEGPKWHKEKQGTPTMGGVMMVVGVVVSMVIMFATMMIVVPKFKNVQKLTDKINGVTRESLLGIRVTRAYNAEKYQETKFDNVNQELTKIGKFTGRIMTALWPCIDLTTYALTLGTYLIGAFLIQNSIIDMRLELFSNIVVFSNYSSMVLSSFMMLATIIIMYPRVSVSSNRILEVLNTEPSVVEGNMNSTTQLRGLVEFKDVSFRYPATDKYVFL